METQRHEIGMIGLGVMGRNMLLNMADHVELSVDALRNRLHEGVNKFARNGKTENKGMARVAQLR